MSAFVELLRKSNLDFVVTRKPLKDGARSDDAIVASLIDTKQKRLQVESESHSQRKTINMFTFSWSSA